MTDIMPDPTRGQAAAVVLPVSDSSSNELVAYSSIRMTDNASKMKILASVSDAEPIQPHLGETLQIRDIIILNTTVTDRNTGEVTEAQRTVLITEDGKSYAAMSGGIIRSLNNLIAVFGEPFTWTEPVPARVVEAGVKGRQYYTLKFGEAAPKGK